MTWTFSVKDISLIISHAKKSNTFCDTANLSMSTIHTGNSLHFGCTLIPSLVEHPTLEVYVYGYYRTLKIYFLLPLKPLVGNHIYARVTVCNHGNSYVKYSRTTQKTHHTSQLPTNIIIEIVQKLPLFFHSQIGK